MLRYWRENAPTVWMKAQKRKFLDELRTKYNYSTVLLVPIITMTTSSTDPGVNTAATALLHCAFTSAQVIK